MLSSGLPRLKFLEQALRIIGKACPIIGDFEHHTFAFSARGNGDRRTTRGIFGCVLQQIAQDLQKELGLLLA
jgi:hypothetical protein